MVASEDRELKTSICKSLNRKPSYSSFFSAWSTDFKNVIFEKIHWASSEVVKVKRSFLRPLRPNFGFHLVMTQLWIELWLFVYIPFRTLSVWCASKWELVTLQYPTTYFVNLTKSAKTSGILLKKKYWVSVVGASFIFFQGFSLEKFGLWEMVLCYQNCSDLLWERIVLVFEKNFWNSRLKADNFTKKLR